MRASKDIGDGDDSRLERDLFAGKPVWIATAVPPFVMAEGDEGRDLEDGCATVDEECVAEPCVLLHHRPLRVG